MGLFDEVATGREFIGYLLTTEIARLAEALALKAGEEVERPLSKEQLARAVAVLSEEYARCYQPLLSQIADWHRPDQEGKEAPPTPE